MQKTISFRSETERNSQQKPRIPNCVVDGTSVAPLGYRNKILSQNDGGDLACGSHKLRRLIKMNTSDTLALSPSLNTPIGDASNPLVSPGETQSGEANDSVVRKYATRTAANLRSIVERRFKRMSEAHDRIRTELLARHSPHAR